MAKPQRQQPRVQPQATPQQPRTSTTAARVTKASTPSVFGKRDDKLVFGRETYKWMLIGLAVMAVGFILMAGGSMPSPDVWDERLIYSTTRTVIAPFLILAGLVVQIYAIFKKNTVSQ